MCGIIGSISSDISRDQFIAARDTMIHRGPNDAGYFVDDISYTQLGHRRLSIIDLSSAGHQPMFSEDGRYVIVFNGEIYNYIELQKELEPFYSFRTHTDTEVLLASYVVWGESCVKRLNGMFAFAIYDQKKKELFCARDRFGEKPFYYILNKSLFAFASEIKGLLALGIDRKPNEEVVFDYLMHGLYDHTDDTFFAGIKKLPSGSFMRINREKTVSIERYWDLEEPTYVYQGKTYEQLQNQFLELLEDAIRIRFRSDVPVGINVSSGVDSTSLLFFSEKVTQTHPHLFSMCLPDEQYNECKFIDTILTSEQKKHWHTSFLQPEEVFPLAKKMNKIQDEPYGGIPTIAYLKLNEQARQQGVTVLLEGQGVDEMLAGYSYYRVEYLRDLIAGKKVKDIVQYAKHIQKPGSSLFPSLYSVLSASRIDTRERSQDMTKQGAVDTIAQVFKKQYDHTAGAHTPQKFASHLLNAQYRDIFYTKLPRVLRFNDHVTMSTSRELRLPYLDHRLVEFCFFLPHEYKIIPGRHKRMIRDAMASTIPEETHRKEKVAFGAVQTPWLRNYYKKEVGEYLESDLFTSLPYFNHALIRDKIDAFYSGAGNNSFFLWQWINLAMWFETYIKNK